MYNDKNLAFRILVRYAASRPMKEEKLKELMLKMRKGSWGTIKGSMLMAVLEYLGGGWKLEESNVWERSGLSYRNPPRLYRGSKAEVEEEYHKLKHLGHSHLPDPKHLPLNQKGYLGLSAPMEVREVLPGSTAEAGLDGEEWQVKPGLALVDPHGKSHSEPNPSIYPVEYFLKNVVSTSLVTWLKSSTKFFDELNAKLGTDSIEVEKEKNKKVPVRAGNTGTCSVCEGFFKLTPKAKNGEPHLPGLVLHGYKRPGTGTVHGNCFGQDWPPYELSCSGTKAWLEVLQRQEQALLRRQRDLKDEDRVDVYNLDSREDDRKYTKATTEPRLWSKLYSKAVLHNDALLESTREAIKHTENRIRGWRLQDLPSVVV